MTELLEPSPKDVFAPQVGRPDFECLMPESGHLIVSKSGAAPRPDCRFSAADRAFPEGASRSFCWCAKVYCGLLGVPALPGTPLLYNSLKIAI